MQTPNRFVNFPVDPVRWSGACIAGATSIRLSEIHGLLQQHPHRRTHRLDRAVPIPILEYGHQIESKEKLVTRIPVLLLFALPFASGQALRSTTYPYPVGCI